MNPIPTELQEKDKVVDVRQVEVEKKQQLVGRITPHNGHTIWEINLVEKTIEPAKYEEFAPIKDFSKAAPSRGFGIIERKDGSKKLVLDRPQPVTRNVIKNPNCIYMSKLNRENVIKQLIKLGIIKIKT